MRRTLMVLVLVAVVAALAAGCAGQGGDEGTGAAGPAAPATSAATGGSASGGGGGRGDYGSGDRAEPTSSRGSASGDADADDVRIRDFAFAPGTVKAKVGQRVEWEHQDAGVTHTVTAVDGAFRSGELEEGDEFSHLFQTAGALAYRCAIHPDMRGTVKVSG